jgi:hypothetical protein
MIRPNFLTTADRLELLSCVKYQREDHRVARRANALLLLDTGMSCSQIAKVLFLDDDTVRSWHKQYLAEDWETIAYDAVATVVTRQRDDILDQTLFVWQTVRYLALC